MRTTFYIAPFLFILSAACAHSAPQPLTVLPPPEFAPSATSLSSAPAPGDIQFTVSEPKAKAAPADETVTTLQPQKASTDGVRSQHVHAAQ
jgi:hypothetical protein